MISELIEKVLLRCLYHSTDFSSIIFLDSISHRKIHQEQAKFLLHSTCNMQQNCTLHQPQASHPITESDNTVPSVDRFFLDDTSLPLASTPVARSISRDPSLLIPCLVISWIQRWDILWWALSWGYGCYESTYYIGIILTFANISWYSGKSRIARCISSCDIS